MKSLSNWAKNHRITARWIIAACHVLVACSSIILGTLLYLTDWGASVWLLHSCVVVFCITYLMYPDKNCSEGWFRHSYSRQKTHDFALVITYGLVIALGVNNSLTQPETTTHPVSGAIQPLQISLADISSEKSVITDTQENQFSKMKIRKTWKHIRQEGLYFKVLFG